jgi:hydrogenase nickel incorporation protein HypA/HybF
MLRIMHELKIAEYIKEIVLETARKEKLTKVTKVNLVFGKLVSVVPENLEPAFREAVKETPAGNTEISIEIVPVRLRCRECGCDYQMDEEQFRCRICGSADPEIINGNEFFIKSIEGE